jgi:hypothetical protein
VPHDVAGADDAQARRRRFDSWIMRRRWAGRHPFWSSLLYGTVNMYLVVPFLVAFDPSYDNGRGDVIWSLAIAYVLYPTLVIWNLWRWQPGGRFHEAWSREHETLPKAVRWPRRRPAVPRT